MCDPLTITGAVLTVGSMAVNTIAQQKVQSARDDAINANLIRQQSLDREADALNAQSRDRFQDFEGQQDQRAQSLGDFLGEQTMREPDLGMTLPPSQSNITVQEEANQRASARARTSEDAENLARLRSFGDLLGSISRDQSRDAGLIGQIGGFKRGDAGVLPLELEAANSKGGGLRLFGDVLGGLGTVGMTAGLSGAKLPGLFGTTPPRSAAAASAVARLPSIY